MIDPVELTQKLIRCPSVTPAEAGAIELLDKLLSSAGFVTTRIDRGGIANLFARWGSGRTLGFNGHTDVVPTGDVEEWADDPFEAVIRNEVLFGRGAVDMKSGVAAFAAAAIDFVSNSSPNGSIVLTITGDEEGVATDGTSAILDWMKANNETMDVCLVGEPTCPNEMGDMMKIGRRGSMTVYVTAHGIQGHSAYPHRAANPLPVLVDFLNRLATHTLDNGTEHFDPSTLAITSIDTGNTANNVIPPKSTAMVNIRFNDAHTSERLTEWIRTEAKESCDETGVQLDLRFQVSGESFITPPGDFSDLIGKSVQKVTGRNPELSTSGGTSDARFIKSHCPVVEFGLVGKSMHQVDENTPVAHIHQLKEIYTEVLRGFFAQNS